MLSAVCLNVLQRSCCFFAVADGPRTIAPPPFSFLPFFFLLFFWRHAISATLRRVVVAFGFL